MNLLNFLAPITDRIKGNHSSSNFVEYLKRIFDEETARAVLDAFDRIGLPAPSMGNQYLRSNEGALILVNKYAVVIRVEPKRPADNFYQRIDGSGCILQPIGTIEAGRALIEICPGCDIERDAAQVEEMKALLKAEGLAFTDDKLENMGHLHTDDESRPGGLPLVIDRLAVTRLKGDAAQGTTGRGDETRKEEQERFLNPLQDAFNEGMIDPSRMGEFWALLERYAAEGKLVCGWNEDSDYFDRVDYLSKTSMAEDVARHYARELERYEKERAFRSKPDAG